MRHSVFCVGSTRRFCSTPQASPRPPPRSQLQLDQLLPPIKTHFEYKDGLRFYVQQDHQLRMPGVTSILNQTKPEKDRLVHALCRALCTNCASGVQGLERWRKTVGEEEAKKVSKEAISRGNELHRWIEKWIRGQHHGDVSEQVEPFARSVSPVLRDIGVARLVETPALHPDCRNDGVRLVEAPVLHKELGYGFWLSGLCCSCCASPSCELNAAAGTVDLVAEVHGQQYLIDWKTKSKPVARVGYLNDYPLQSAGAYPLQSTAYLGAIAKTYPELKVSKVLIVFAVPNQDAQVWEFDRDEMLVYWNQWVERLHAFRELEGLRGI